MISRNRSHSRRLLLGDHDNNKRDSIPFWFCLLLFRPDSAMLSLLDQFSVADFAVVDNYDDDVG